MTPVTQQRSIRWLSLSAMAVVLGLPTCGVASAQTAIGVSNARVQAVHAEWRKLSQGEVNCIDHSLRAKRSAIWFLIQRGIAPTDASVAGARAACRTTAQAQTKPAAGHTALAEAPAPEEVVQAAPAKVAPNTAEGDKITIKPEDAAAQKAAAELAAIEKAAAEKAAADRARADKATAEKSAAAKAAIEKYVFEKTSVDKPSSDKSVDLARAEAERAQAEAATAMAQAERARKDAEKVIADVGFALAAAQSRLAFIYGLAGGPVLAGLGFVVFLVLRRKNKPLDQPAPV